MQNNNKAYQVNKSSTNVARSAKDTGFFIVNNRPSAGALVADGSLANVRSNRPIFVYLNNRVGWPFACFGSYDGCQV